MNLTKAVVRSVDGGEAVVEVEATGCGRCDEPGGCGGASKADLFCRGRTYRVLNPVGARAGEQVSVAIADGAIGVSATRAYLVPLLLLIFGAVLGRVIAGPALGDGAAVAGAVLGVVTGWLCLRLARPARTVAQPTIVARA